MARGSSSVRRLPLVQPLAGTAVLSSLVEMFFGTTLDTSKWTVELGTPTITGGKLGLLATTSYNNAVVSRVPYNALGSSLMMQVTPLAAGSGSNQTGFDLRPSQLDNTLGQVSVDIEGTQPLIVFNYRDPGTQTQHGVASITSPLGFNPTWLRIREAAGTTYCDYSADGMNWTNVGSIADPIALKAVYVEIWAGHYAAETDTTALFDNVNIVPQIVLPNADLVTTGWATAPLFSKVNDSSDATVITATLA